MSRMVNASRPRTLGIACALRSAVMAGTLALAGTAALAQQGWEATVSTGPAQAKAAPRVETKIAAPKPKPAAAVPTPVEASAHLENRRTAANDTAGSGSALETGSIKGTRAEEYCANIAAPAADARFAWQKKLLADMEQEIAKHIVLLEERAAEYQKWLARRDEFSKKANETVLRIYAKMRPDAAAAQLAALDGETAASVLTKLEPRVASLILSEMDPTQAVRLTATISGAGKVAPAAALNSAPEARKQ
jgi:flagellar motility protein MotE (MotC chaperone)